MVSLQKRLLGEKGTGPNATDRAKSGTKRSILVDSKGVPLGVSVDAANRHDMKMTKATFYSIAVHRPEPATFRFNQHMCMDKLYDFPEVYQLLEEYGYTIYIRLRRRKIKRKRTSTYRSRRLVVGRTFLG
jgi:putative transposase